MSSPMCVIGMAEVVTIGRWLIHVQMTDTGQILAFQPDELELVRRRQ
jgi:hypothetical protein